MKIKPFTQELLDGLVEAAGHAPRARQHFNLHESYVDPCQRFLNAIGLESYVPPHRHALDPKTETLVPIRGLFALVVFNDDGQLEQVVRFGSEAYQDDGVSMGVQVSPGTWHTVVALSPGAVMLELKAGPYDPHAAKELAPWAPIEGSPKVEQYLGQLRQAIVGKV